LGTPKDLTHAAWFNLGPRPGQEGNAIIDGHYGWIKGVPAVFNDLYTLKPGSKIYIEDQKGNRISFVVREIKIYDKDEDASGVFTLSDGKAHLNLITCEGVWISALKTYSNRLVVFADKE
jgi:LPXTG-site transpeptidase (sortase) family protein